MKKKIIAAITAFSILTSVSALLHVSADEISVPVNGAVVYPEDNILNILVKDPGGKLVNDAEMKLKGKNIYDIFDSGGTYYEKNLIPHITWYPNESDEPKTMFIPFESFKEAANLPDAFGMSFKGSGILGAFTGSYVMEPGETKEVYLFTKNESDSLIATLDKGEAGVYVDPKWAANSAYTGFILLNDLNICLNPGDDTGTYGTVSVYNMGNSISHAEYGLSESGVISTGGSLACPNISKKRDYIMRRTHISELSDKFGADGTFTHDGCIINPRKNMESARMIILIISGAMINAVIPDENGYVTFLAENEERFYILDACYTHRTSTGGAAFGGVDERGTVADKHTAYYTAVELPSKGAVLTTVPAGEYTLSFTKLPAIYKNPGDIQITIDDKTGIQTIEINLKKSYNLGDVDENGQIDINDATLALREYALETTMLDLKLTSTQRLAADVNENEVIDMSDATSILKYYAYMLAAIKIDPETIFKQ